MHKKAWSVVVMGGMLVAAAVLSGCGGGSGRRGVAKSGSSAGRTTVTAPTTAAPGTAVPATTATASTPNAAAGGNSRSPVLIVRSSNGTVSYEGREPATIGFSGDSTNIVTHLTWSSWGPSTAVGHGSLGVNDCKPNCAMGTVTQEPATVDLGHVVDGHFTAMTEKSASLDHSYTYPSNWAATAA